MAQGLDDIEFDRGEAGITSDDVPGLPLDGGFSTLQTLANVLERLLEGYCMEIIATNTYPDQHVASVKQFAKDLVLLLAFHLAERISSLLRQVLDHPTKVLCSPSLVIEHYSLGVNFQQKFGHKIFVAVFFQTCNEKSKGKICLAFVPSTLQSRIV